MKFSTLKVALIACALAPEALAAQGPTEAAPACCTIPALTEIEIEILTTLNSQGNRIGEKFPIRLAKPIVIHGKTLVPAGATGSGDIVHAEKSRFGGRAGEMILAARYIEHDGQRIGLRSLRPPARGQGKDNSVASFAAGAVTYGVLSMFITGGEVNVPAGTIMTAKISVATTLPASRESTTIEGVTKQ